MLVILSNGRTRDFLELNVAGRSLAEEATAHIRSVAGGEAMWLHEHGDFEKQFNDIVAISRAGEDLLFVNANVWLPSSVARGLMAGVTGRHAAVKVCGPFATHGDEAYAPGALAVFLSAAVAVRVLERSDVDVVMRDVESVGVAAESYATVETIDLNAIEHPLRVEDLIAVAVMEKEILDERAMEAIRAGVRIHDPASVAIRGELTCGADVVIDRNVIFEGRVLLGDGARIGANSIIINSTLGTQTVVHPYSLVDGAVVGARSIIGPYGRVRPESIIGDAVQIGSFVEIKKSSIGSGSRINHLAFVGDATLGDGVTLGAGTITCNHDGSRTQHTRIDARAYVGSGSQLVAPVHIGADAVIGAGSTITREAPAGRLTIARSRQVTSERWKRAREEPNER